MKVGVAGCAGRMGRKLLSSIVDRSEFELSGGTEKLGSKFIGQRIGSLIEREHPAILVESDAKVVFEKSDAIIDFTLSDATLKHVQLAAETRTALIIGTTGIDEKIQISIEEAALDTTIVQAGNMSLGINVLIGLAEQGARALGKEWDVEIVDNFVELNKENSSFNLTYNINAGNKFLIKNLSLTLPDDYSKEDFTNINKIFDKNINENYSLRFINSILDEIENIASNRLYDFIDAKVEEEIVDGNKLNLNFIVSDSKKYYVERINILGNYSTIEEVIRNKLIVDEGDPLNNLLFNKSINEIKSLNIFKTVNSQIKDGSNDNLKILDITVEEQPTGEISLSAGFGTNGVATGGGINEKNFLGKGINLNTNLEITEESLKGQIIYSRPNFAYTDNTLFTSLRSVDNDFLTLYGYESTEIGFSIGTKFEQYENLFFSPELDFLIEDLTTNVTASSQLKKQEGSYTDFYFNYGLDYDMRDSSFNTKNGYITKFMQQLPIVSENNEISNTIIYTKYNELIKSSEMVGKASLYLKAINTIDGSDVRVSKRANVPYNRLRGFEKGKVGPVDGSDYIGGNYISTLNLSTNIPGILSSIEILDFNYFIDIGNVWGVDYNSSLDKSKIRSSTGIGLNVLTPVGPLSFSLAQPITKASSDKTETFRFNLGTTF